MLERVIAQSEASQGYNMKGEIRMSTALKCDRCHNYFDYDPSAKYNFISFGHKDIIIGKNFPVKDICPSCMEQFMMWFENTDNYVCQDLVKDITEEYDRVIKSGDRRAIAHFKNKHGYTMTKEEINIVNEDKVEEEDKWTDEDCDGIGCWECKYFRQDKNIHNPYDEKDAYYCSHKKLYISGNMSRPDYMDMRYTDFDKLGCKEK